MDHWLEPMNVDIDRHTENKNYYHLWFYVPPLPPLVFYFLHQDLLKEIAENAEKKYIKKWNKLWFHNNFNTQVYIFYSILSVCPPIDDNINIASWHLLKFKKLIHDKKIKMGPLPWVKETKQGNLYNKIMGKSKNRPNRPTRCCTQFKSRRVKILCVLHLH